MKRLVRTCLLVGSLALAGTVTNAAFDRPLAPPAEAAPPSIGGTGVPGDFRCFLCTWAGCMTSNAGGAGCDDSIDSCQVVDWGCVQWPAGASIAIRW